jgi:hypothetical protein
MIILTQNGFKIVADIQNSMLLTFSHKINAKLVTINSDISGDQNDLSDLGLSRCSSRR